MDGVGSSRADPAEVLAASRWSFNYDVAKLRLAPGVKVPDALFLAHLGDDAECFDLMVRRYSEAIPWGLPLFLALPPWALSRARQHGVPICCAGLEAAEEEETQLFHGETRGALFR